MEHFDSWMTDRSITRKKVDNFMADISNVGKKMDGKYLVYTTSGSTGNPCIVLYDETTINVSSAISVLRSFARKQDMKAFMKQGKKNVALFAEGGFYLASGSVKYNLQKMPWKKNVMKSFDVRKRTQDIVDMLNEYQPTMIGSYPTALELLAYEQESGNLHVNPVIIMTGGEHLSEEVRERLSKVFRCYVQTNYSCTEGGTVACECTEHHFHVNDDWIIYPINKIGRFAANRIKKLIYCRFGLGSVTIEDTEEDMMWSAYSFAADKKKYPLNKTITNEDGTFEVDDNELWAMTLAMENDDVIQIYGEL